MKISRVEFRNFASYGNRIQSIDMESEGCLHLITGNNGNGKSTLANIIKFLCYGKVDGFTNSDLPNRINKELWGKIYLEAKNKKVEIERGISPSIFKVKIDGVDFDQAGKNNVQDYLEEELFGISANVFKNLIILSINDFKSFLTMSPSDKKMIVDKIFGFSIINQMLDIVKKDKREIKSNIKSIEDELGTISESIISTQKKLDFLEKNAKEQNLEKVENLKNALQELSESKKKLESAKESIKKQQLEKESSLREDRRNLINRESNKKKLEKELELFKKEKCPTCHADLSSSFHQDLKYQIEKIILSKHIRLPFLIIASPIVFLKYLRLLLRVFFNNTYKKIKVNSVFFTLQSLNSTSGKDTYFGLLPKKLSEFSDVLIVYLASGWKIRLRNTKKSAPIESFIGVLNSLLLFKSLFFIRLPFSKSFIKSPFNDSFSNNIFVYLVSKEIKQGIFHQHIFLETAIREMLKKISLNVISYPFENRSWEKLLVFEAKNAGIQKIIGYQHSSITPRHLSFKINSQCIINHYLPSKILTCGHVTFNWLKKNSYLIKSILVKGVSFRIIEKKISAASKESLLVALSSSKSEAFRILYIVSQISKSLDLPIVIRAHPTINLSDLIKKFSFSNKITISNSSLEFDIRNATMVAYSSSTVALEAMLHGRFPVFFDIGDVPTGDPILGHLDYNRNVKSLKDFLFFYNWKLGLSSFELRKFRQILISSSNDYLVAPIDKRSSYLLWI